MQVAALVLGIVALIVALTSLILCFGMAITMVGSLTSSDDEPEPIPMFETEEDEMNRNLVHGTNSTH